MPLTRKTALFGLLGAALVGYYYTAGNDHAPKTSDTKQAEEVAAFRASLKPVQVPEALQHLPNLRGQGYLRDMREAAVLDKRLRGLMQQYIVQADPKLRAELILPILDAWIATSRRDASLDEALQRTGATSPIVLTTSDAEDERVAGLLHRVHSLEVVTGSAFFTLKGFTEDVGAGHGVVSLMSGAVPKQLDVRLQDGHYRLPAAALNLRPQQTKYIENAYQALAGSMDRAMLFGRYQYCLKHPAPGVEKMNGEKLCRTELAIGKVNSPWAESPLKTQRGG